MQTAHKKPLPLFGATTREPCPVCGHASYSLAGIHPQCAVRAADKVLNDRIKARQQARPDHPPEELLSHYHKRCPGCKKVQHVRKQICDCGRKLSFGPAPGRARTP